MINLIIVMILSALAVILVFSKWSKKRDKRLATPYFTFWSVKEIMLFIAWVITTSVCALSLFGIVTIFIIGGFE